MFVSFAVCRVDSQSYKDQVNGTYSFSLVSLIFEFLMIQLSKYSIQSNNSIIYKVLKIMGVCIGACSRVDRLAPQINPNEKKQIETNLQPNAFEGDHCNIKTAENDHFYPEEQVKNIEAPAPAQQVPKQPEKIQQKGQESKKAEEDAAAAGVINQEPQQLEPQVYRNRKIDQGITNLLNRGKKEQDNKLIESTLNSTEIVKLSSIQLDNGIVYDGEWKNAMRQGDGTQVWADGSRYVGQWKNNKANGKGILYHSDGDIYEGEWLNDKANGQGTYTHSNGAKYIGEWKDDKQNGFGVEEWLDGQKYQGQYKNGTKTGKGVLKFLDGSYYEGEFFNNEIHGKGVYVWCKNRKYEGQWQNNKMHGYGVTEWTDGRKYQGQYNSDKKHGIGTFQWADGRKYHGSWKDGKQHGRGQYYLNNGEKKIGQWVEGKRIKWVQQNPEKAN